MKDQPQPIEVLSGDNPARRIEMINRINDIEYEVVIGKQKIDF